MLMAARPPAADRSIAGSRRLSRPFEFVTPARPAFSRTPGLELEVVAFGKALDALEPFVGLARMLHQRRDDQLANVGIEALGIAAGCKPALFRVCATPKTLTKRPRRIAPDVEIRIAVVRLHPGEGGRDVLEAVVGDEIERVLRTPVDHPHVERAVVGCELADREILDLVELFGLVVDIGRSALACGRSRQELPLRVHADRAEFLAR